MCIVLPKNGHVDVCTVLLENNANIEEERKDSLTPLLLIEENGRVDLCSVLFGSNTNVNKKDNFLQWYHNIQYPKVTMTYALFFEKDGNVDKKNNVDSIIFPGTTK